MNLEQLTATISDYIWSWPMIILLLGTHIFLTFRLRVPQRKIFTAIKLSFTKDKGSTGDVSQFSALATSLAATIGTGNIIGVVAGSEISRQDQRWHYAWRTNVCPRAWSQDEVAGCVVLHLHRHSSIWNWQRSSGQRHQ